MGSLSNTVSGNIASFKSASIAPIESLKVYFNPVQEGTGDPSLENIRPITGWTRVIINRRGKNWFNDTLKQMNETTVQSSGKLTFLKTGKMYKFSANGADKVKIWVYNLDGTASGGFGYYTLPMIINFTKANDFTIGMTFQKENSSDPLSVNEVTSVQIEEVDSRDQQTSTYEPYNGQTIPIIFPRVGKNLLDLSQAITGQGLNSILFGREVSDSKGKIFLKAGTYTFSSNIQADIISITNSKSSVIGGIQQNTNTHTFTLSTDDYIGIMFYKNQTPPEDFLTYEYQLEEGNTATTYELYNNTIYGGYIDLINGTLIQEWNSIIIDGTNIKINSNYSDTNYICGGLVYLQPYGLNDGYSISSTVLCNNMKVYATGNTITTIPSVKTISNGKQYLRFYLANASDHPELDTKEKVIEFCNNYFIEHPTQIVYKLDTPITHQLSPHQLKTLLGKNNIWSNTNDITEVTYQVQTSSIMLAQHKKIIDAMAPHLEIATGDIATFNTDVIAPLKEAKVYFNPVQEGTGDPSPENVREISGWTGLNISQYGNNLIDLLTTPYTTQSIISYNISNNTLTLTANSGGAYFGQYTALYNIDEALRGKEVFFGVTSITLTTNNENHRATVVCEYRDKDNKKISDPTVISWTNGSSSNTIARKQTIPENAVQAQLYFRIAQNASSYNLTAGDTVTFHNFYIRYPATTYEYNEVNKQIISLDWSSTAGTLYGGYIDLISGKLVATHKKVRIDRNLGGWTYNYFPDVDGGEGGVRFKGPDVFNGLDMVESYNDPGSVCNCLPKIPNAESISTTPGIMIGYMQYILFRHVTALFGIENNANALLNYLDTHQIDVTYPLAEPIVYQLTPQTLKALKGTNNIWSNANGPVEISYWTH